MLCFNVWIALLLSSAPDPLQVCEQKRGLRALALSIGGEAWSSELGSPDVAASAGPNLGKRVPWGASFAMVVDVEGAMILSIADGVRKVDFCTEVRE
jgi:hypothetical protein